MRHMRILENSKTPVAILDLYIIKHINLLYLSVSRNRIAVVRLYWPVELFICVCLSVHHRIPAVFPAEFPLTCVFSGLWSQCPVKAL